MINHCRNLAFYNIINSERANEHGTSLFLQSIITGGISTTIIHELVWKHCFSYGGGCCGYLKIKD